MTFLKQVVAGVLAAALLGALPGASFAKVTAKKIEKAETVADLVSLGATKLSAQQFNAMVVGKEMSGQGWTWSIDADGTTSSAAEDGSWKEDAAPWSLKGDTYCAKLDGKLACRDVYLIGSYLRMSDKDDPAKLSSWTVKLPN